MDEGFDATALRGGLDAWRAEGYEVEAIERAAAAPA